MLMYLLLEIEYVFLKCLPVIAVLGFAAVCISIAIYGLPKAGGRSTSGADSRKSE